MPTTTSSGSATRPRRSRWSAGSPPSSRRGPAPPRRRRERGVTGAAPAPAVLLSGVTRHYGGFAALDGVDLSVSIGESILLLGPNGAGKTTLLRLLALLARPTAGEVRLFGEATRRGGDRGGQRRRIGFLAHQT